MSTPAHREQHVDMTGRDDDDEVRSSAYTEGRPRNTARDPLDREFAAHRDRVRWGPLWAGVLITIASFLVMQLAIFAADLFGDGGNAGTWLTAVAALVAFFLGGLVVGASALWHKVTDGLFNGVVLWALATVGLMLLAIVGGGTLLGPISTVASDLGQIQDLNLQDMPTEQINEALQGARDAAGWSLLGIALSLVASAAGGALGAKMWPRRDTAGTTARDPDRPRVH